MENKDVQVLVSAQQKLDIIFNAARPRIAVNFDMAYLIKHAALFSGVNRNRRYGGIVFFIRNGVVEDVSLYGNTTVLCGTCLGKGDFPAWDVCMTCYGESSEECTTCFGTGGETSYIPCQDCRT